MLAHKIWFERRLKEEKQKKERKKKDAEIIKIPFDLYGMCCVCSCFSCPVCHCKCVDFSGPGENCGGQPEMLSMNVQMMDEEMQKVSSYLKEDIEVSPEMEGFLSVISGKSIRVRLFSENAGHYYAFPICG